MRFYASALSPHGLTFPQYQVLLLLWAEHRCTVGTLCAAMDLDSSTLTPLLKRLEAVGYLRRERDTADERRVIVSLTPKGSDFQQTAQAIRTRMLAALGPELVEIAPLHLLLRKLSALIDRSMVSYPNLR